jgi:hypothetical protein
MDIIVLLSFIMILILFWMLLFKISEKATWFLFSTMMFCDMILGDSLLLGIMRFLFGFLTISWALMIKNWKGKGIIE